MPVYSYSRIGAFEQCPRRYKFRYIEKPKIEVTRTIEQYLGDRVHKALEKCYNLVRHGRAMELDELLALYDRLWQEDFADDIKIVREDLTAEDYIKSGRDCLEKYHARWYPFDQEIVLGLEKMINFALDEGGQYRLQGFIDRLSRDSSGRVRIHDYKTSSSLPTQQGIDRDMQLALYQIAVEKMWPDITDVELVWHYLKFDTALVSHRSDGQLEELKKDYISKIREIENAIEIDRFPTNETALCDWCEYYDLCPAKGGTGVAVGQQRELPIYKNDDIAKLVDRYIELDGKRKEVEAEYKALKQQLVGQGEVGTVRLLEGSGSMGIAVKLEREMKLPTKAADEDSHEDIRRLVEEAGLYPKYSKLDTLSLQKDLMKGRLPLTLDGELKKLQEIVTKESVRIKKLK